MVISAGPSNRPVQSATAKELQLPSMVAFTQKNSTQQCLLRTLNTTTLLRETMRQQQQQLLQQKSQTAPAEDNASASNATATPAGAAATPSVSTDAIVPMETEEGMWFLRQFYSIIKGYFLFQ